MKYGGEGVIILWEYYASHPHLIGVELNNLQKYGRGNCPPALSTALSSFDGPGIKATTVVVVALPARTTEL